MKKNMGLTDRIIRLAVSITLVGLYAANLITGAWGLVGLVLAGIFTLTSLVSFCPLYLPFGIRTNRLRKPGN